MPTGLEIDATLLRKPLTPESLLLKVREALAVRRLHTPPLAWTRASDERRQPPGEVVHSDIRDVAFPPDKARGKKKAG